MGIDFFYQKNKSPFNKISQGEYSDIFIFLGFQKNKYILGYEDFVDIFLGSSQNWTIGY